MAIILIIGSLCGATLIFSGCEKEPPEPVYEIRLYDDNWVELEHGLCSKKGHSYIYENIFEYDGEIKCFNAIAYRNGEEIYRFDYKDPKIYIKSEILAMSVDGYFSKGCLPVDKGEYTIRYFFVRKQHYDPFPGEQFPVQLVQSVIIKIV